MRKSFLTDIDALSLSADLDDLQTTTSSLPCAHVHVIQEKCTSVTQSHLLHLLWRVQHGADYHDSVKQVQRNPVWRADVLCAPGEQHTTVTTSNLTY